MDKINIAEYRIGSAPIPVQIGVISLVRLAQMDTTPLAVQVPGFSNPNVRIERVGTVLCQDSDIVNFGVHTIRQGKINDPIFTGKRYGWLGTLI